MLKAEYRHETEKPLGVIFWGFPTQCQVFPPDISTNSKGRFRELITKSGAGKREKIHQSQTSLNTVLIPSKDFQQTIIYKIGLGFGF